MTYSNGAGAKLGKGVLSSLGTRDGESTAAGNVAGNHAAVVNVGRAARVLVLEAAVTAVVDGGDDGSRSEEGSSKELHVDGVVDDDDEEEFLSQEKGILHCLYTFCNLSTYTRIWTPTTRQGGLLVYLRGEYSDYRVQATQSHVREGNKPRPNGIPGGDFPQQSLFMAGSGRGMNQYRESTDRNKEL